MPAAELPVEQGCSNRGRSPTTEDESRRAGDRTRLLQVIVCIADEQDGATLNELWDAWVPAGYPPVRAMVHVGLAKGCKVGLVVTAATAES